MSSAGHDMEENKFVCKKLDDAPILRECFFGNRVMFRFTCLLSIAPIILYFVVCGMDPSRFLLNQRAFLPSNTSKTPARVKQAVCSNTARVKFVHDACQSVRSVGRLELGTGQHVYDHILIDDANRMLFCDAPKTGSSFFKNLWLNYTRGVDGGKHIHQRSFLRKHNLRYLNSYNHSERLIRLKTYFKFMVARHPMVRVLSAYREKLELPNQYYHSFLGRPIERQYGHVPPRQSKGDNVTFEQMVRYLVDRRPTVYDHHWTPVSLLCKPCEIQYDYIARLETSNVDYEHIFSKLKDVPGSKKGLPESVATLKGRTDFDNVKNYYQQVPLTYINTLVEKYNLDFHLFGYTWNKTLQSYGCRMTEDGKECC